MIEHTLYFFRKKNTDYNEVIFERGFIMKITDMIISAIIKKGICYEARNVDTEFTIPREDEKGNPKEVIKIHLKCEHMNLRIDKDGEAK